MRAMKPFAFAVVVGGVLGALLSYVPGASATERPAQNGCVTETHACSSGSCSRPVPDGGQGGTMDAGISLAFMQGYSVNVCGTAARPLAGAGTLKDYHCSGGSCAEVVANAQPVTLVGTAATRCQEFPPFVIPAALPSADRMVWASAGVTISNWDAGAADTITVTVCPTN